MPTLGEGSICRRAVESLIEHLYKYVAQGGYLLSPKLHTARYAGEYNVIKIDFTGTHVNSTSPSMEKTP